jgi:hypothetical protein
MRDSFGKFFSEMTLLYTSLKRPYADLASYFFSVRKIKASLTMLEVTCRISIFWKEHTLTKSSVKLDCSSLSLSPMMISRKSAEGACYFSIYSKKSQRF